MNYSLLEAVADIAYISGEQKHETENSRQVIDDIISWAQEFEKIHEGAEWGVNTEDDYIDAIYKFTMQKLKENSK